MVKERRAKESKRERKKHFTTCEISNVEWVTYSHTPGTGQIHVEKLSRISKCWSLYIDGQFTVGQLYHNGIDWHHIYQRQKSMTDHYLLFNEGLYCWA